jgi:1,2-diacylglycerol-3-alpha-glucose alpha-1,2-galactosyltransferase
VQLGVKAPIEIFYNFIDNDNYKVATVSRAVVRSKMNIPDDAFVVIGAGQVQPRKRVDSFFAAAAALPDVHFVWVGGMPFGKIAADSANMADMIDSAPINVHFPGILPLEEMVSYYRAADLFWLPSEQETFGLVVVEAAAAGLPVMVRDIPDYDDTFGAEAIKSTDENAIELIRKLQSDRPYYQQWQTNAAVIANRFDSRQAAAKLVKLYEQLV